MKKIRIPPDYYDQSLRENLLQRLYHQARFRLVTNLLGRVEGELLDVGCASGVFTEHLAEKVKGEVWGVDKNPEFIVYAKKVRPKLKFLVASAERLPFEEERFEVLTCLEVLEHLPEPQKALLEFNRVLKRKGRLLLLVPTQSLLFRFLWFFWTKGKGRVWQGTHLQKFKKGDLEKIVKKSGLQVLKKKTSHLGMLLALEARKP